MAYSIHSINEGGECNLAYALLAKRGPFKLGQRFAHTLWVKISRARFALNCFGFRYLRYWKIF